MRKTLLAGILATHSILAIVGQSHADEVPEPVDLLSLKGVQLSSVSAVGNRLNEFRALTDDDLRRLVEITLEPGIPFDFLYALPEIVTCEQITIAAQTQGLSAKQLPSLEVLASTLSADSGFQSLRSVALKASTKPQSIKLPASAAQWLIIRLIAPADHAIKFRIAEFDLHGRTGVPETRYAFKEAPAKAFDVLASVQQSVELNLTADELSLFKDAKDGKLDVWTFAEAALLTSGVKEKAKRQEQLAKIDKLVAQAKEAVADAETPLEKAELLLKWLHKEVMPKGYKSKQTDVAAILDSGTFNCVSSATLYNVIGRRLGLDLRAIEVPDHAFSILYVGSKHADVETTNPHGFNPGGNSKTLRQFTEQTGFLYIPDRHGDKRREVNVTGLLAITCYNHGVLNSDNKQYAQALTNYFRALSLDPEFSSAIQNVVSVIGNWAKELSQSKQYAQALKVLATGIQLAPNDKGLNHHHKALWQNWAVEEIENNRTEQALQVLSNAHKAIPDGGFEKMQAFAFIQPGEKLADGREWAKAISLASMGMRAVSKPAREELQKWRISLFHRWTGDALKKKDFASAATVLEQAVVVEPGDKRFKGNISYVVQEWLRNTHANNGLADAEKLLHKLAQRFGQVKGVDAVLETYVARASEELTLNDELDDALAVVDRNAKLLSKEGVVKLKRSAFDRRAAQFSKKKDWQKAVDVYSSGLKALPDNKHLTNNLHAMWDSWANGFRQAKKWREAADVYSKALDSGLNDKIYSGKLGYCTQQMVLQILKQDGSKAAEDELRALQKKRPKSQQLKRTANSYVQSLLQQHLKAKKPKSAFDTVTRCQTLVEPQDFERSMRFVCDQWARQHIEAKEWKRALDIYTSGLKQLPNDKHLVRNSKATWDKWARTYFKDKKWADAIQVYEKALKEFPKDSLFENNLKYCKQQATKTK